MLKSDFLFSAALHAVIILATFLTAPFTIHDHDYGEVIRVSLASSDDMPMIRPDLPVVETPAAVEEDAYEDIPISDPTTAKAVEIKPKDEPKKEPEKPKTKPKAKPTTDSKPGTSQEAESDQEVAGTGAGTPFSGARTDNASFNYPAWFGLAFRKLSQNFRNPVVYDGSLYCTMYFQVIKSGRVIDIKVVEPSEIPAFNEACELAIERAAPFPPLPREFREEIIGITLTFTNH